MSKAPLNPVDIRPRPFTYETMNVTYFSESKGQGTFSDLDPTLCEEGFSDSVFEALSGALDEEELDALKEYTEDDINVARVAKGLPPYEQLNMLQMNLTEHICKTMLEVANKENENVRDHIQCSLRLSDGSWAHVYSLSSKPFGEVIN